MSSTLSVLHGYGYAKRGGHEGLGYRAAQVIMPHHPLRIHKKEAPFIDKKKKKDTATHGRRYEMYANDNNSNLNN